ncbi:MAG: hypothetical protein WC770_02535 [Phycisphaerae bacterium]
MEKDENRDNKTEQDIDKCRQDLLNSIRKQQNPLEISDSMPSFGDILKKPPAKSEFVSNMVEKISKADKADKAQDMPSLDLGVQILAQQRKIAALKRKSPGKENISPQTDKQEIKFQPVPIKAQPAPAVFPTRTVHTAGASPASPQQMIIADIVAKEILALSAISMTRSRQSL